MTRYTDLGKLIVWIARQTPQEDERGKALCRAFFEAAVGYEITDAQLRAEISRDILDNAIHCAQKRADEAELLMARRSERSIGHAEYRGMRSGALKVLQDLDAMKQKYIEGAEQ